jgi:metallo-beta-lactamase family protein
MATACMTQLRLNTMATYINTVEESQQLDTLRYPAVIISASGMATGGRVLHHLKAYLPRIQNTILFAGYQARETLGKWLIDGAAEVKIHGQVVAVRAEVKVLSNLSAHGDYAEILAWLSHFKTAPRKVFITHGEPEPAASLQAKIIAKFGWKCEVPHYLQTVELS